MRVRIGTYASSMAFVSAWMTREEALFWLGLAITVLQLIYAFYEQYSKNRESARSPNKRASTAMMSATARASLLLYF